MLTSLLAADEVTIVSGDHTVCLCWLTTKYVQGQRVCSIRIYLSCMKKFGRTNRLSVVQEPADRGKYTTDIFQGLFVKASQKLKIDASAISRWLTESVDRYLLISVTSGLF